MEQWVKAWVGEQRGQGVKCLEVKMRGKMYYVYHSSTYWDKALKKPRKISKYLGALDPDKGLIKSGGIVGITIRVSISTNTFLITVA